MATAQPGVHVELHVSDFGPVLAFYGALGFQSAWHNDSPGHDAYLVMTMGHSVLRFWPGNESMVTHHYFSRFDGEAPRGLGVELVITVDDVDAAFEVARRLDAVVEPLKVKPWGLRDFRCIDPFGYYLRFTEHHDVTAEDYGGKLRLVD